VCALDRTLEWPARIESLRTGSQPSFRLPRSTCAGLRCGAVAASFVNGLPSALGLMNANYRHDRHNDYRGGDEEHRRTSVAGVTVSSTFRNQASSSGEEADKTS